ncbi:Hypothetical protein LUCI_4112 [Lucifera butyrica]|uniref:Histidine kinase/HSP90-like ATPase domain-containing protein n=1 Tax=Lucifera butyrica TaxID=1351585 RepID=A0A498RBJ9_9FIRM|nr:ATP-binding protein [Lucifera butyrica]VBB08831.1 Hypothetical protein LUCI_4112 [Lucifera butyrica]
MKEYEFSSLPEFAALRDRIRNDVQELCPEEGGYLFLVVNEAVNNALFHGNQEDPAKKVWVRLVKSPADICIIVRDEGTGYNPERLEKEEISAWAERGRGLDIIRLYVDSVSFNQQGNEIVIRKRTVC